MRAQLRSVRKENLIKLSSDLQLFLAQGHLLEYNGKRMIIYNAFPAFINNKPEPSILSLSICPIFDSLLFKDNNLYTPSHIQFQITNWTLNSNGYTGFNAFTGGDITSKKIHGLDNHIKSQHGGQNLVPYRISHWYYLPLSNQLANYLHHRYTNFTNQIETSL